MRISSLLMISGLVALTGCQIYPPTPTPDYTIRVMPTSEGMVAIPPECPSWTAAVTDPFDNQPPPQYGCAQARNLALMVETPQDLVKPKDLGETRGVALVGAMRRYDNNQTRGLLYIAPQPDNSVDATSSTTGTSALSGDITGSAGSSSSSSSSSSSGSSSGAVTSSGP